MICECLSNNPILNNKKFSSYIEKIVDTIDKTDISSYRKATMMHYLSVFMKCNESLIKDSQIEVIKELTDSNRVDCIHLFTGEEGVEEIKKTT